jgi:hypothetical protein
MAPRELAAYDVRLPNQARRPCVGVRRVRVERLGGTTVILAPRRPGRRPKRVRLARGALPYAGDDCLAERSPEEAAGSP